MLQVRPSWLGAAAVLSFAATALTYTTGVYPGKQGTLGPIPPDIARSTGMSCGQCHTPSAPVQPPAVSVTPAQRSLDAGQSIGITTTVTGGVSVPGFESWGGFVNEVTAGTFTAGSNSQVDPTAKFVTHKFAFLGRSWQYGYVAPQQPGPVELYAAANTVNGDGQPTGDAWAFHGSQGMQLSVPVRLFVNAPGVTHRGDGCAGAFGNVPVLGASQSPAVGNGSFGFELRGAPPMAPVSFLLGMNPTFRLRLDAVGVPGCTLWVDTLVAFNGATGPGSAPAGGGGAIFPMPIPNNPFLRGATLQFQAVIADPGSGRRVPVTLSNAVSFTIQ